MRRVASIWRLRHQAWRNGESNVEMKAAAKKMAMNVKENGENVKAAKIMAKNVASMASK
jgi:heterodisulfide reductase subunit C